VWKFFLVALLPSGDADIQDFYGKLLTGPGGEPAKGTVLSELIVKFFHGDARFFVVSLLRTGTAEQYEKRGATTADRKHGET